MGIRKINHKANKMEPTKILAVLILLTFSIQTIYSILHERKNGVNLQRVIGYSLGVVAFTAACVIVIVGM